MYLDTFRLLFKNVTLIPTLVASTLNIAYDDKDIINMDESRFLHNEIDSYSIIPKECHGRKIFNLKESFTICLYLSKSGETAFRDLFSICIKLTLY